MIIKEWAFQDPMSIQAKANIYPGIENMEVTLISRFSILK
jgi:hypothetical protein